MSEANQPLLHVLCSACGHMGCEHLAAELKDLRAAALASLEAGDAHVSEEEAFRRLTNLARLVGYTPGAPPRPTEFPPKDLDALTRWASGLARWISGQVEVKGSGWAFALFLYREPGEGERAGQVLQVSRDREKTKEAVARWLMDLLSPPEKGAAT